MNVDVFVVAFDAYGCIEIAFDEERRDEEEERPGAPAVYIGFDALRYVKSLFAILFRLSGT